MNNFIIKSTAIEIKKEHNLLEVVCLLNIKRSLIYFYFEHNGFILNAVAPMFLYRPKNIFDEVTELKGYMLLHINKVIATFDKKIFNNETRLSTNYSDIYDFISFQMMGLKNLDSSLEFPKCQDDGLNIVLKDALKHNLSCLEAYIFALKQLDYNTTQYFGKEFHG